MTPRLTVEDPDLRDIIERQPVPISRRAIVTWAQKNWLAIVMAISWGTGQVLSGDRWMQARSTQQDALANDLSALRRDLQDSTQTYVRHDVFEQVLRRIDDHLASIDQKINSLH